MESLTKERLIKSLAVIGILLLGMVVVFMTENILVSFVLGFVIYYLLDHVVNVIERSGISRRLGTTGLFILISAALAFGVYILLPATAGQLSAFKHTKFWQSMDTLRDRNVLEEKWNESAPWKNW